MENTKSSLSAILILGPGQLPDGSMLPWGKARIETAYQRFIDTAPPSYVILSGGKKSHVASEASTMRDFIQQQYPQMGNKLLLEELSSDTLQNVFFSKVMHIDPLEIKKLSIVTNSFHMPRTKHIFKNLFNASYDVEFLEAIDPQTDEKTRANQTFIEESLREFNENVLFCKDINTNLKMVHAFIFNLNADVEQAYKKLITNLQPFFA